MSTFTSPPPPSLSLRSTLRPSTPLTGSSIVREEKQAVPNDTLLVYGAPLDLLPQLISQFKSYGPSKTLLPPSCNYFLITYTSSASREKALCQSGKIIAAETGFVLGVRPVKDNDVYGEGAEEVGDVQKIGNGLEDVIKIKEREVTFWEWFWKVLLD
ncbi:hypothetical protein TrVE_jg14349 [Triparma verrucosa]|uniref:RRM Nup35-type domain-containing protein n=1 Tax=Triparma verrucosa TaxID=1606542 RepID=A0A9W7BRU6_9STRA|nr:hypothetical protein TrVE_jg14349 [Triparma verrucosa]